MTNSHGRIERHTGSFEYENKVISFTYWSHLQNDDVPDTVIFLGTGQTGRIARWAAKASPIGVVVVEGAPHWHAHPSANDLYDFTYGYTKAAVGAIKKEFSISSAHFIAQSQAAPGVVRLGNEHPQKVDNVVLLAPLGFAATVFGDTPDMRVKTLMKRARQTFFQRSQSPLYDPRNLYVGYMILMAIFREAERGASRRKYSTGLSYDMLEDFRKLVDHHIANDKAVILLLGEKDKVFMAKEIQPLVEAAGIRNVRFHILPGVSHLSLGVRGNKRVLQEAVALARQVK